MGRLSKELITAVLHLIAILIQKNEINKYCIIFICSSKSSFRCIGRVASSEGSGSMLDLTTSPCESASFAEMEVALRERDYELSYLRQTMEHNEQVIFKVYQEKEHAYERELRKLKALHESRLRAAAQKSLKLEQMLMIQTYQVINSL